MIHGWRGKIGVMHPSTGMDAETMFHKLAPEGVAILFTRLPLDANTTEAVIKMAGRVEDAAATLAQAKVDLIVFWCTGGSLAKGFGYDQELIRRIESTTGIRATTTTTAVVEGLQALGAKKVAIATPYPDDVNIMEKKFLEDSGFAVTAIKGLGVVDAAEVPYVRHDQMYKLAREVFTEEADAVFLSCTGISVLDIIAPLEQDLQRPVITSNQATIWASLRKINVREKVNAPGRLWEL